MAKVVFITGGSSGIGETIANYLAAFPAYKVYATSRSIITNSPNPFVHFIQMDVNNESSVKAAFELVLTKENCIDLLVNNAGVGFAGPLEETEISDVQAVFETNVFGLLACCKAVLPTMRKQGFGKIINISSIAGRFALPFRGVYAASKFAVEAFTETLSQETQQFGIQVCTIEPGDFYTNINQNRKTTSLHSNSVYSAQFNACYAQINNEVAGAEPPTAIAKKIKSLLETDNWKIRYVVASPFQRFTFVLKVLLPQKFFEKLIMNHYKIPRK